MALVQIRRRSVHTVIETVQDESSSGEGAFETVGAGAAGGCGWRDSSEAMSVGR